MCLACHAPFGCAYLPVELTNRLLADSRSGMVEAVVATAHAAGDAIARRSEHASNYRGVPPSRPSATRLVYDMNRATFPLPGRLVRADRADETGDTVIDAAHENCGIVLRFLEERMQRSSIDDNGWPIVASVRYGRNVMNAFWDGSALRFGEGDGIYFGPFCHALDIVAHEIAHGLVAFTSDLVLEEETGALHESFCDVFGAIVTQWHLGQSVAEAVWRIGKGAMLSTSGIESIRTFTEEKAFVGHIYLGDDVQPKHMRDFVRTTDDRGGIHINSGIPNHAFYLAATALGGNIWERAGLVWLNSIEGLSKKATFVEAATKTVLEARKVFEDDADVDHVRSAWARVGVEAEST